MATTFQPIRLGNSVRSSVGNSAAFVFGSETGETDGGVNEGDTVGANDGASDGTAQKSAGGFADISQTMASIQSLTSLTRALTPAW
jgi:hypothetical protein